MASLAAWTHGFGVVAVHVENRGLNHLGDVGRIGRESALPREGGEADLVVDDHVDRAAGAVIGQFGKAQGFVDDALAAEGGVAVDQDGDDAGAGGVVAAIILLGADDADDDGIDQLQMAGVVAQGDVDAVVVAWFGGPGRSRGDI